jgi:hypothetical protein
MTKNPLNAWPSMPLVALVTPAELTLWQAGMEWTNRTGWQAGNAVNPPILPPAPMPAPNEDKPEINEPCPAP